MLISPKKGEKRSPSKELVHWIVMFAFDLKKFRRKCWQTDRRAEWKESSDRSLLEKQTSVQKTFLQIEWSYLMRNRTEAMWIVQCALTLFFLANSRVATCQSLPIDQSFNFCFFEVQFGGDDRRSFLFDLQFMTNCLMKRGVSRVYFPTLKKNMQERKERSIYSGVFFRHFYGEH